MKEKLLKILDCNRKEILRLPSGAVHVWFAYYISESEHQESYMSVRTIAKMTGLDKNTVMKWRDYLIKEGWIVLTGATAADRYSRRTRGAHKVPVVRVDDPKKCMKVSDTEVDPTPLKISELSPFSDPTPLKIAELSPNSDSIDQALSETFIHSRSSVSETFRQSENVYYPINQTKVYGYGSSYGSSYGCSSVPAPLRQEETTPSSLRSDEKPKPKPSGVPVEPPSATRKKAAKDGTPYPPDFNSWSNVARCEWLANHAAPKLVEPAAKPTGEDSRVEPKQEPPQKPPVIAPSPKTPPPPSIGETIGKPRPGWQPIPKEILDGVREKAKRHEEEEEAKEHKYEADIAELRARCDSSRKAKASHRR